MSLNKYKKILKKINALESKISQLSDSELQNKTNEFKEKIKNGVSLDKLLPEAFAVSREACKRVLGKRPYDVQLISGMVIHEGKIAEQKTGEGKTLTAVAPVYLNALTEKGVHVVTVNDYLAQRDAEEMGQVYNFLGLSCGFIVHDTSPIERKKEYCKSITHISNAELGFDYLRSNLAISSSDKIQRPFYFCLVDEADNVLIDDARTPLIISAPSDKPIPLYLIADIFAKHLTPFDYEKDEELGAITLTESGLDKAEKFFHLSNYSNTDYMLQRHHIQQALRANYMMKRDKEYIVKKGEVILIDEGTGRIADGRRYNNGLHQAIEAKEGVQIKEESVTMATVTYQNFFKLYEKFSGMTGTAATEKKEFKSTYGLDVVVIPTHRPIIRVDKPDLLYATEKAKNEAIIEDIKQNYSIGRPVLVGTFSIKKSETLSQLLKKEKIPHQVLNAKHIAEEAAIVAKAGQKYAVTIATNMAGRGTDIKLGEGVAELGGLKVIACERAENRRIDNQLKGRSGRQGDPGESQFYLSFEDELIKYISEYNEKALDKIDFSNNSEIKQKRFKKIVEDCQIKIEDTSFASRKDTLKYDKVLNTQRLSFYRQRDNLMNNDNCVFVLRTILENTLKRLSSREDFEDYMKTLFTRKKMASYDYESISNYIDFILNKMDGLSIEHRNKDIRRIILGAFDRCWIQHLVKMEELKEDVMYLSYRGEDPVHEYVMRGQELLKEMKDKAHIEILKKILNI